MATHGASALLDLPPAGLLSEVADFCARHGITREFDTAYEIIQRHFPEAQEIQVSRSRDPEVGDEWISVRLKFAGDAAGFRARHRAYLREFVDRIPLGARAKMRLGCGIVRQ